MIQLTAQQKLLLAIEPADFRKGIDSLCALCKQRLTTDPYSGVVFAFCNKKKTAVKLLSYDGNGFWLAMKRFSKGKLAWWPNSKTDKVNITAEALQVLLSQGDPRFMKTPMPWRQLQENNQAACVV